MPTFHLIDRFRCGHCPLRYITKLEVDGHMEEQHMEAAVLEDCCLDDKDEEEGRRAEMTAEQAKLGVNILLWTESKYVKFFYIFS